MPNKNKVENLNSHICYFDFNYRNNLISTENWSTLLNHNYVIIALDVFNNKIKEFIDKFATPKVKKKNNINIINFKIG